MYYNYKVTVLGYRSSIIFYCHSITMTRETVDMVGVLKHPATTNVFFKRKLAYSPTNMSVVEKFNDSIEEKEVVQDGVLIEGVKQ